VNDSKNKSTFSLVLKTIFSIQKGCPCVNTVINGPCLSDRFGIMDQAFCLRYNKWPSKARQWVDRPRFCGWPPESLINNIVQRGVLLVPIGSKSDSHKDNPFEWRISFSVPEKMLIYSFLFLIFIQHLLIKTCSVYSSLGLQPCNKHRSGNTAFSNSV
jgi:hypothetical protein